MNYSKYERIKQLIADMKLPDYRYEQIIKAVFLQHISTFERMSTLPIKLKETLIDTFGPSVCVLYRLRVKLPDKQTKYYFRCQMATVWKP